MKTDYRKKILNLTEGLPVTKLKEVVDFIGFLKAKEQGFSYKTVSDSVEYVQKMRSEDVKGVKSGKEFIEELIRWQESSSL
ncbi:MAG: hypothetical protein AB1487_06580 [Thermodesulfobacteriota bacterium]